MSTEYKRTKNALIPNGTSADRRRAKQKDKEKRNQEIQQSEMFNKLNNLTKRIDNLEKQLKELQNV